MRTRLFSILGLLMVATTNIWAYDLTIGTNEHGTVTFKVDGTAVTTAQEGQAITISITPDDIYKPTNVSAQAYTTWDAAKTRSFTGTIDLLNEVEISGSGNEYTFTMPAASVMVDITYKREIQDSWVQDIADVFYNGSNQEPTIIIKDGETTISADRYTVSYENNKDAGDATATVTIKDSDDDYTGQVSKTFKILEADPVITSLPTAITSLVYKEENGAGVAQALITAGSAENGTMKYALGENATTAPASGYAETIPTGTNADSYYVWHKVEGDANYSDTEPACITVTIAKAKGTISYAQTVLSKNADESPFTNELTKTGDGTVTYISSNPDVATVDANTGEVKMLVKRGETVITATVTDGKNYTYETNTASYNFRIKEIRGDLNLDGKTDKEDLNALVSYIMGEKPEDFHVDLANLNNDTKINAADVVELINIIRQQE